MDQHRPSLSLIQIPLYISAALYGLIGIGMILFGVGLMGTGDREAVIVLVMLAIGSFMCFALAGFIGFVTSQLSHRKKWAWVAAVILGAMYAPSAFFFLGIPILIGCFNSEVNAWFNTPAKPADPEMGSSPPYAAPTAPYKNTQDPYQPPRDY